MKKIGFVLTAMILTTGMAYAAQNFDVQQNSEVPLYQEKYYPSQTVKGNQTLKGSVVTVPAGQNMPVVVTTPIDRKSVGRERVC